jgi:F0F1-type ATP synthase assembly protein I
MSTSPESVYTVRSAMNLALARVFLLSGIAGLLVVMTGRLGRIIDRGRALYEREGDASPDEASALHQELRHLERRRHFASMAINACTISALLVCLIIGALFIDVIVGAPLGWLIGGLFTVATLALVVGVMYVLREVHSATRTVRIHVHH